MFEQLAVKLAEELVLAGFESLPVKGKWREVLKPL